MSTAHPVPVNQPPSAELDLADIQGIVLRSYKMPFLRTLALRIEDVTRTKAFLLSLADRTPQSPLQVQSAVAWDQKPQYCINVGLTADGLRALQLPAGVLKTFPPEFLEGAAARAAMVGDTGVNDPANWIAPFNTDGVHILLVISAQSAEIMEDLTRRVKEATLGATTATSCPDGVLPADHKAHFGYVDGISQPRVAGVPRQKSDASGIPEFTDPMALVPPGAFVLGHESQHPDWIYPMPTPDELGKNGSFAALRVLKQDCAKFEAFLNDTAKATGMHPELIAAKLCGRWRTGVPLALSPHDPDPARVPVAQWNQFDYSDDPAGKVCPMGSHIRRNNPRRASVAGDGGERHRIMRRGLPYGPPYDSTKPDDGIERGLLGLFICGNLRDQFEFLMKEWVNDGDFAGLGTDRDPILGNQPDAGGRFRFPVAGKPQTIIRGMSTFVTTRAGAYCFLPSITGLRYLAALP